MKGRKLDLCLSMGYFRMQQEVFTCRYVVFEGKYYPAYWLRINLARATLGTKQARLFRINGQFWARVKPLALTEELEMLYSQYRDSIDFDAPASVTDCLFGDRSPHPSAFDTYAIEIRNENRLIAVGIFDNGEQSIAGIMNFYDPAYRKQSLGKYLMLLKMKYAQQQGKAFYYPGYLVGGYAKFDYKLFACEPATEVFDTTNGQWLPFSWEILQTLF